MFYPPIFGSSEGPVKAGCDELSPNRIKWLKSQVFSPSMPLQKSGILPFPYVFYPPIFGSSEGPVKAGCDELSPIRIKWLKSQVFSPSMPIQKSGISLIKRPNFSEKIPFHNQSPGSEGGCQLYKLVSGIRLQLQDGNR